MDRPEEVVVTARLHVLLLAGALMAPQAARAQLIEQLIPDYAPGLTGTPEDVQARMQPEYAPRGVRVGSFVIRPQVSESIGYDSNVDGLRGGRGSLAVGTQASVGAAGDWERGGVSVQLGVDDQRYPERSIQDFTSWNAGVGGSYHIGPDTITGGYTHLNAVQTPRDLSSETAVPVPFQVDDLSLGYTVQGRGRLSLTPGIDVASYRYDDGPIVTGLGAGSDGLADAGLNQSWQDRVVAQESLTARFELSPQRNVIAVVRGTEVGFHTLPGGLPDRNSSGVAVLLGLDYAGAGLFRYRVLGGYQERDFASATFAPIRSPIVEASVTWTPRRTTTVTTTARREIDDSSYLTFAAYVATDVRVGVAHELRRNVVLTAFGEFQRSESGTNSNAGSGGLVPFVGGQQNIYSTGIGATWLVSRVVRLGGSFQFVDRQAGPQLSFTENVGLLTLSFGL